MLKKAWKEITFGLVAVLALFSGVYLAGAFSIGSVSYVVEKAEVALTNVETVIDEVMSVWPFVLDKEEYDKRVLELVGFVPPQPYTVEVPATSSSTATTTKIVTPTSPLIYSDTSNVTIDGKLWPPSAPYPNGEAILPFNRILAYYGNFYSRQMGILGEYEPEEVVRRLAEAQAEWEEADPNTPVVPAIEYIAMVAQADAGSDGMYRAVMPDEEIEKAYDLALEIGGIMIFDIQVGLSPTKNELPKFKKYLERPEVHLALDPEFSMKRGNPPGTVVGTYDAADINYVIGYLADIVNENKLPPKVLLIHRFTQNMVTNSHLIKPRPEVQVVMVMDGWGSKDLKRGTYSHIIVPEPVQFTGIKIFYKNDLKPPSTGLLTPAEVLDLHPKPIYIQYQ